MKIKFPRVTLGFFIYLVFSICLYSYIYMKTINIGSYGFDDFIGWGRLFPTDIGFYSNSITDFDVWNRNTLVLSIINSTDSLWLFYLDFIIMQVILGKIYKFIDKNNLFLLFVIIFNINIFSLYPNKDFYSIISIGYFILYIYNKSKINFILSLFSAAIARPEMTLLIIFSAITINMRCLKTICCIALLAVSIFYKYLPGFENYEIVLINGQNNNFGLSYYINNLSKEYSMYALLFPIKLLMAIWESGLYYFIIIIAVIIYCFKYFHSEIILRKLMYFLFLFLLYASYPAFIHFRYISPALLIFLVIVFQISYISNNNIFSNKKLK